VGRRFVRDRGLLHAVLMGYGELVPHGRYPTAVVFVDAPAGSVDVNVHPQKVEVRFARPQEVAAAGRHGVARVLARAPWLAGGPGATPASVSMYALASDAPPVRLSDVGERYAERQEQLLGGMGAARAVAPAPAAAAPRVEGFFGRLSYRGQLDRTSLLCE